MGVILGLAFLFLLIFIPWVLKKNYGWEWPCDRCCDRCCDACVCCEDKETDYDPERASGGLHPWHTAPNRPVRTLETNGVGPTLPRAGVPGNPLHHAGHIAHHTSVNTNSLPCVAGGAVLQTRDNTTAPVTSHGRTSSDRPTQRITTTTVRSVINSLQPTGSGKSPERVRCVESRSHSSNTNPLLRPTTSSTLTFNREPVPHAAVHAGSSPHGSEGRISGGFRPSVRADSGVYSGSIMSSVVRETASGQTDPENQTTGSNSGDSARQAGSLPPTRVACRAVDQTHSEHPEQQHVTISSQDGLISSTPQHELTGQIGRETNASGCAIRTPTPEGVPPPTYAFALQEQ